MSVKIRTKISFTKTPPKQADTAVVFADDSRKPSATVQALDKKCAGLIGQALKKSKTFTGKAGESLCITLPEKTGFAQVLCVGIGKAGTLDALGAETIGGKLFKALEAAGATRTVAFSENAAKFLKNYDFASRLAAGLELRSYAFDHYRAKDKSGKPKLAALDIVTDSPAKAKSAFERLSRTTQGVFMARELVNEPPNHLYPDAFARRLKRELEPLGVGIDILDEKKMQKLGMGALLAVGMGSEKKPRIVVMHWKGTGAKKGPLALVGKGVTFDTGGISIKPAAGMHEMKMDMGGAAAVAGTIRALALRKARTNVVGIVGLAENMPSHNAYRPGDILKSYSGKTIEVLNTDAEGRLVLADVLTYVQKTYKPHTIIDLATLTGAMMVALGFEYCGTFANDDKLWSQMEKASAATGEKLWRMPLDEIWKKDMEGDVADLQNLGKSDRYGGACTAAGFLEHFIEDNTPWAHMDIAGTAWSKADKPTVPKYGTGFGVRVLERLIADNYED
jgi:leucyl aminopeptidase